MHVAQKVREVHRARIVPAVVAAPALGSRVVHLRAARAMVRWEAWTERACGAACAHRLERLRVASGGEHVARPREEHHAHGGRLLDPLDGEPEPEAQAIINGVLVGRAVERDDGDVIVCLVQHVRRHLGRERVEVRVAVIGRHRAGSHETGMNQRVGPTRRDRRSKGFDGVMAATFETTDSTGRAPQPAQLAYLVRCFFWLSMTAEKSRISSLSPIARFISASAAAATGSG